MKIVQLEVLMKNGSREKIAPVWDQYVDDQWIQVESDNSEKYTFHKSQVAKATFKLEEYNALYQA